MTRDPETFKLEEGCGHRVKLPQEVVVEGSRASVLEMLLTKIVTFVVVTCLGLRSLGLVGFRPFWFGLSGGGSCVSELPFRNVQGFRDVIACRLLISRIGFRALCS